MRPFKTQRLIHWYALREAHRARRSGMSRVDCFVGYVLSYMMIATVFALFSWNFDDNTVDNESYDLTVQK